VQSGWGKELTYIIAFSVHGVMDVTRRYTKKWQELLIRRKEVSEIWLTSACLALTSRLLSQLDSDTRQGS
jgi:peptide-N4-(N-acetyl-beta-glucosaminyl)asparagine amidase